MSSRVPCRHDTLTNCGDTTSEALNASGAVVPQESRHYGARDRAFRHPAGNALRFSQPPVTW
jgi:hypothetical protein